MSDGFLSRWTRRKQAVRAAEQAERVAPAEATANTGADASADTRANPGANPGAGEPEASEDARAAAAAPAPSDPPESDAPLPELPDPGTLTRDSDLAPFLRAGVPTVLRNAALRRMWSIDPAIRDFVSEAREYAYDWNSPGGVPGLGPLLPSDDVEAMLRRIVGVRPLEAGTPDGSRSAAAEEAETPDAAPPNAALQSAGPQVADVRDAPVAPDPEHAAGIEPAALPDRAPALVGAALAHPARETVPAAVQPTPETAAMAGPRLRRHGGARPA